VRIISVCGESKTFILHYNFIRTEDVAQGVEVLPGKQETLSSNFSLTKKTVKCYSVLPGAEEKSFQMHRCIPIRVKELSGKRLIFKK
jgi:hypothetical protein